MADEYLTAALYGMKRFNEWASKKVKELMWMEKLIELLNEYNYVERTFEYSRKLSNWEYLECSVMWTDHDLIEEEMSAIIKSKEYWFIKWLVENDKIDFEKKLNTLRFESLVNQTLDSYLALLMLLSIQDNPIEFLVSILK